MLWYNSYLKIVIPQTEIKNCCSLWCLSYLKHHTVQHYISIIVICNSSTYVNNELVLFLFFFVCPLYAVFISRIHLFLSSSVL